MKTKSNSESFKCNTHTFDYVTSHINSNLRIKTADHSSMSIFSLQFVYIILDNRQIAPTTYILYPYLSEWEDLAIRMITEVQDNYDTKWVQDLINHRFYSWGGRSSLEVLF